MLLIKSESVKGEFLWRRWLRQGSLARISKSTTEIWVHMEGDSQLTLEAGPAMELASLVIVLAVLCARDKRVDSPLRCELMWVGLDRTRSREVRSSLWG
jgi:hypothetical protein